MHWTRASCEHPTPAGVRVSELLVFYRHQPSILSFRAPRFHIMSEGSAAAEKKKRKNKHRSRSEKSTDTSPAPAPEKSKKRDKSPSSTSQSRRRQARADSRATAEAEAGPGPSTSANREKAAAIADAEDATFGDDFVAFGLEEDDNRGDVERRRDGTNGQNNTRREDREREIWSAGWRFRSGDFRSWRIWEPGIRYQYCYHSSFK